MRNFVQPGDVLTLTAPSGGVVSGSGYKIGNIFAVAAADAAQTEEFEGQVTGTFDLPKTSAQAWTEGALVYWDETPGEATTVATGNLLIGIAAAIAANPSATGRVRLNGAAGVGGTISTTELEDGSVTLAKMAMFISTEQTGTGSAQNIAHGLGVAPSKVLVSPTELVADLAAGYDVAQGSHTTTNVVVTVTSGAKFQVLAIV